MTKKLTAEEWSDLFLHKLMEYVVKDVELKEGEDVSITLYKRFIEDINRAIGDLKNG